MTLGSDDAVLFGMFWLLFAVWGLICYFWGDIVATHRERRMRERDRERNP